MNLRDKVTNKLSGPQPDMARVSTANKLETEADRQRQYSGVSMDAAVFDGNRRGLDSILWKTRKSKEWIEIKLNKENK